MNLWWWENKIWGESTEGGEGGWQCANFWLVWGVFPSKENPAFFALARKKRFTLPENTKSRTPSPPPD